MRERIHALLMKPETEYGVDSVPTAAVNGIQLEETLWNTVEIDYLERNIRETVSGGRGFGFGAGAQPSGRFVKFTIKPVLKGSGAAAQLPEIAAPFGAAGLLPAEGVPAVGKRTWSPFSAIGGAEPASYSCYMWTGKYLITATGVRARLTGIALVAGRIVLPSFECMGLLAAEPAVAALPVINYPQRAIRPPVVGRVPLLLNGYGPPFNTATFDMGTDLAALARGNAPDGIAGYDITDYKPTLKVSIDAPDVALFNPWALERLGTPFPWSVDIGEASGAAPFNRWRLEGPAAQIVKVSPETQDKRQMVAMTMNLMEDPADPAAAPFSIVHS